MNPFFNELKEVTSNIMQDIGKTTKAFENTKSDVKVPRHITTINEGLVGQKYPGTNIEYKKHSFILNGEKVEGVFPVFYSLFDTYIPKDEWNALRSKHDNICNQKLIARIENDPAFASKFTPRQLEIIKTTGSIAGTGLTWHHTEIPGRMQLVETKTHQICRHTGGYSLWGGGSN